ncbi:MAG: polysaccharide deacetylase family protein [Arachidicoccus sp.]|nr:polysaccharide deacetylase family protein [Arachidicoccus sp.]
MKKYYIYYSIVLSVVLMIISCKNRNGNASQAGIKDTVIITKTPDSIEVKKDTNIKTEGAIPNDTVIKSQSAEAVKSQSAGSNIILDSTKKYVYLTFDDGPQPGTSNVYHNLKALNLKGTFFMVGLHATFGKTMHDLVDSIRDAYPQILLANHSYTHAKDHYEYFYHHVQDCFNDFLQAQSSLNVQKKFIRLPGNSAWVLATGIQAHPLVKPVCELLDSAGYNVIGWDAEWSFKRDPSGHGSVPVQSAETMVKMVENALNDHHTHRKNAIVLLSHDRMFNHQNYSDSLYKFMYELKTRNPDYIFETVDHYPDAKM